MKRTFGLAVAFLVGFLLWRLLEPRVHRAPEIEIEEVAKLDRPSMEPQPRNPREAEICRAAFETMGLKGRIFVRESYLEERQRFVSIFESVGSTPDYCYLEGSLIHWRPETAMGQVGRWRDLKDDGQLSFQIRGNQLSIRWAFVDSAVEEAFTLEETPAESARRRRDQERAKKAELLRKRAAVMPWYRRFYPQLSRTHAELGPIALAVQRGAATDEDCSHLQDLVQGLGARGLFDSGDPSLDHAVVGYVEFASSMMGNCPNGKKLIVMAQPTFLDNHWGSIRAELIEMDL